jgi:hypothetical protein
MIIGLDVCHERPDSGLLVDIARRPVGANLRR